MTDLLLLHGAIGAADQLAALDEALSASYRTHRFSFSGHGGKSASGEGFSIPLFAQEAINYLDEQGIQQVAIFGYSMGGYVAAYLAVHHPERVQKIVTLATKWDWSPEIALKETGMLDPEKIQVKLPDFASTLAKRHAPVDWKENLKQTAAMMLALGTTPALAAAEFPKITCPMLLCMGDRDKMVSLEESLRIYRMLPNAAFSVLPYTPHPIEQVNTERLLPVLSAFLSQ